MSRLPALLPAAAAVTMTLLATLAGGCSSNAKLAPQVGQRTPDRYVPGQPYKLSPDELAMDCRKLTGRMQIRILQIRDADQRGRTSSLAQSTHSAVVPVLGGTTHGADPAADLARDRAELEAFNRQLAAKGCNVFDLDEELRPRSFRDTPTPIPAPKR